VARLPSRAHERQGCRWSCGGGATADDADAGAHARASGCGGARLAGADVPGVRVGHGRHAGGCATAHAIVGDTVAYAQGGVRLVRIKSSLVVDFSPFRSSPCVVRNVCGVCVVPYG
jgi:hypothetical protein